MQHFRQRLNCYKQATEVVQAVALDPTDGTVLLAAAAPVQATAPPRPYGDF